MCIEVVVRRRLKGSVWQKLQAALICMTAFLSSVSALQAETVFATVAEALTAVDSRHRIEVHQRMFTVPIMVEACKGLTPVAKLRVPMAPIDLRVGEWFSLRGLSIVGVDTLGRIVPLVPVHIDVETKIPPLFDWDPEKQRDGAIQPLREGTFVFRVRTICSQYPAVTSEIPAIIHH